MLRRICRSEPTVRRRLAVGERVRDSGTLAGEPGVGSGVVEGALLVVDGGSRGRMVVLWGWVLCLFLWDLSLCIEKVCREVKLILNNQG